MSHEELLNLIHTLALAGCAMKAKILKPFKRFLVFCGFDHPAQAGCE